MEEKEKTFPDVEDALLNEELETKETKDVPKKITKKKVLKKNLTEGTPVKRIKLYVKPGGMRNFENTQFKITESKDRLTVTVEYLAGPRKGTRENYSMSDAVSIEYK